MPRYTDTHIAQFLGRELLEIESSYPRVLRPDVFTSDSNRYRAIADTVTGGGPPKGDTEYTGFVALVGQYESNVGFRGAAAEFHEAYDSFRDRVLANDFQNVALPRTSTAPLVLRDDFVCVYRDLVTKIRPNAVFCDKTFEDPAVVNSCSGTRSVPQPPQQPAPSTRPPASAARAAVRRAAAAAPAAPAAAPAAGAAAAPPAPAARRRQQPSGTGGAAAARRLRRRRRRRRQRQQHAAATPAPTSAAVRIDGQRVCR